MILKKLLKIIKKHNWWSEEAPAAYFFIVYPLYCFIEQAKYFHPRYASIGIFIFQNDFFYEESSRGEKYEIYKYIFEQTKKDKNYLRKKKIFSDKGLNFFEIGKKFEKEKSRMSNKEIWQSYKEFMLDKYMEWLRRGIVAVEGADIFTDEYLPNLIQKEIGKTNIAKLHNIMINLVAQPCLSFMEKERIVFLGAAIAFLKNNQKELSKNLNILEKNYFWTRNTFANTKRLKAEDYLKEIKQETKTKNLKDFEKELFSLKTKISRLKKAKAAFCRKYKFSKDLKLHFRILEQMGAWIDYRKENMLSANHYIYLYCEEIAKRFKEDLWKIKYYLPDEIKGLLLAGKKMEDGILKKRREFSVYVVERKNPKTWKAKHTIFYGKDAKKIYNAIFLKPGKGEIRGQIANAPVKTLTGEVQIILDTYKQKFTPGRILVTSMTRPDFVPIMRRAKAIITDEGGITCHAAIVSRELGIPCIIGTKVATKILKTGDTIELDLKNGIVKKI